MFMQYMCALFNETLLKPEPEACRNMSLRDVGKLPNLGRKAIHNTEPFNQLPAMLLSYMSHKNDEA